MHTGFKSLDEIIEINKGDLVIVASRPAMGKTAFVSTVANYVLNTEKKPVLFWELEEEEKKIKRRLISLNSMIEMKKIEIYSNQENKLKEFNGIEIITVYYKAYEEINELQKDVIKIDRQYMLKNIFNSFLNNQIYLDYKVYLEEIEEIYQNFESIPICEWGKRKEIYYMFAKKYNQNIKDSDKKMKVVQFNGSTFIDWYEINKLSGELSTSFKKVYLSLNINYEKYELRIRGIAQKECSRQAREKVEQQISNLCNEENLKTSSFSYRKIKENSNIFIAKINLIPEDKCKELLEKIKILESILNSIT